MSGSIRHSLRCLAAEVLHGSGSLRLYGSVRRKLWPAEVCVLGLHRVLSAEEYGRVNSLEAILMRESTFGEMLAYLKQRFQVISLDTFLQPRKPTRQRTKPLCLITFDDGWRDNYTTALPLLRKFDLPAVVFLATATMGQPDGFWVEQFIAAWKDTPRRDRMQLHWQALQKDGNDPLVLETVIELLKHKSSAERDRMLAQLLPAKDKPEASTQVDRMLSWQEAMEMAESGVEIGSHTVNHPLLPYEDDSSLREELAQSKRIIEGRLGKSVSAFEWTLASGG